MTRFELRLTTILATAAAAFALSACGRHDDSIGTPIDTAVSQAQQAAANAAPVKPEDEAITTAIKAKFAADSSLGALNIAVLTRDGLVTLSGAAPDASTRDHATRLAATVKNVLSVENQMSVPK